MELIHRYNRTEDLFIFFLMAVVILSLASYTGDINEFVKTKGTYMQVGQAFLSQESMSEGSVFNDVIYSKCFGKQAVGGCAEIDFTDDGIIDEGDKRLHAWGLATGQHMGHRQLAQPSSFSQGVRCAYDPCKNVTGSIACGAPVMLLSCEDLRCNIGPCKPPTYNPCAGAACGTTCTACPPNDPTCLETAVLKECNSQGYCVLAPAQCDVAPPPPPGTTPPPPSISLPAPSNISLRFTCVDGEQQAIIRWRDTDVSFDDHHIYRCLGRACNNYVEVGTVKKGATRFADTSDINEGVWYGYQVKRHRHRTGGEGMYSEAVQTTVVKTSQCPKESSGISRGK